VSTTDSPVPDPILVEVTRSGFVESVHRGSCVVIAPDGTVHNMLGDPERATFPRSANKPMQAVAMVADGLDLPPSLLALAAASHSGEAMHLDGVHAILSSCGLSEASLGNANGLPLGRDALRAWYREGRRSEPIAHNCSGKHSAMLATCIAARWPIDGYLAMDHPLQSSITNVIEELAEEPCDGIGIDGCGAPTHRLSLVGLARAYRTIAQADDDTSAGRVRSAMLAFPEMVGGSDRDVSILMRATPGLLVKDGAEGVIVGATITGWACAVKLADGAGRGRVPVLLTQLAAAGIDMSAAVALGLHRESVLGGGAIVGEVRPATFDSPV
jgi:L-asparaginase II